MITDEQEVKKEDLRVLLTEFWLTMMGSTAAEPQDQIKVSELLAKYILGEGKTLVRKRGGGRPTTADVLKLVRGIEEQG